MMKFITNLEKSNPELNFSDEKLFTGPENSYWLIPGKILCGEYPYNITDIQSYCNSFVDLRRYKHNDYQEDLHENINYNNYPITDHGTPSKIFCKKIIKYILTELENNKTIYIHCHGGHGRTGIITAILLKHLQPNISGKETLQVISHLHSNRIDRGNNIPSPETDEQREYVIKY